MATRDRSDAIFVSESRIWQRYSCSFRKKTVRILLRGSQGSHEMGRGRIVSITRPLPKGSSGRTHLEDLETHTEAYVTIGELARVLARQSATDLQTDRSGHLTRDSPWSSLAASRNRRGAEVRTTCPHARPRHGTPRTNHSASGQSCGSRTAHLNCLSCAGPRISVRMSHLVCDSVDKLKRFLYHAVTFYADTRSRYSSWTFSHRCRAGGVLGRQPSANLQTDRKRCAGDDPVWRALLQDSNSIGARLRAPRAGSESKSNEYASAGTRVLHAIAEQDRLAARAAGRRLELTGLPVFSVVSVQVCLFSSVRVLLSICPFLSIAP